MDQPIPRRELLVVIALMTLLVGAGALFNALQRDVTRGYDEVAHVSYIAAVQRDRAIPLTSLRLLDPATFRFTAAASYLNHPPLYYLALASIGPHLEGDPRALVWYRFLNSLLALTGTAACLWLGANEGRAAFYAFAVPLVAVPVLMPLAGAVNNDNAAFCGGAITLLALSRLLETGARRYLAVAACGLVLAGWAKLTGLLLTGGAVAAVGAYCLWRGKTAKAPIMIVAAALAVAALPYVILTAIYGSPAPDTAAQHAMLATESQQFGWSAAPRLPFPTYAVCFVGDFFRRWLPGFEPRHAAAWAVVAIPVAAVLVAVYGSLAAMRRIALRRESTRDVLVAAAAIAAVMTFACHIAFSYQRHLETGWMRDAYPRYYLPVVALVPRAGLSAASGLPAQTRTALLCGLTVAPLLLLALVPVIA